jgi:hypothetical protein
VENFSKRLTSELEQKLGCSEEELKPILVMEESKFQEYLDEQSKKIHNWKSTTISALQKQRDTVVDKMKVCGCVNFYDGQ